MTYTLQYRYRALLLAVTHLTITHLNIRCCSWLRTTDRCLNREGLHGPEAERSPIMLGSSRNYQRSAKSVFMDVSITLPCSASPRHYLHVSGAGVLHLHAVILIRGYVLSEVLRRRTFERTRLSRPTLVVRVPSSVLRHP